MNVLDQVARDLEVEEIIPNILERLTPVNGLQSVIELRSALNDLQCPDMYEDVQSILEKKHDMHFINIDRQRSHIRGR